MQKTLSSTVRRSLLWLAPLVLLIGLAPQKAQAQWAVFDSASWTEMGKIWNEDISTNAKLAKELAQGASLLSQTMQIYGLARQEASYLSKGQILLGIGFAAQHAQIPGHANWDLAMTGAGGIANAGIAWQQMTNPNMSLMNRIQLVDSFATSTLNSIGSCNAAAVKDWTLMGSLEGLAIDMSPQANTAASQRNLANLSAAQQNRWHECEENLAEQQAKLALLHAQEIRDRDQTAVNTATAVNNYNAQNAGEWNTSPDEDIRLAGMH